MGRMQNVDDINKMQQFYQSLEERAFHEAFKDQDEVKFLFYLTDWMQLGPVPGYGDRKVFMRLV